MKAKKKCVAAPMHKIQFHILPNTCSTLSDELHPSCCGLRGPVCHRFLAAKRWSRVLRFGAFGVIRRRHQLCHKPDRMSLQLAAVRGGIRRHREGSGRFLQRHCSDGGTPHRGYGLLPCVTKQYGLVRVTFLIECGCHQCKTFLPPVPCAPANLSVHYNTSTARVTWGAARGAGSYWVQAVTGQGSTVTCNSTGTSCSLNGLQCSRTYNVTATARNLGCNSAVTSEPSPLTTGS